jgi:hypothetical protein
MRIFENETGYGFYLSPENKADAGSFVLMNSDDAWADLEVGNQLKSRSDKLDP